MLARDGSSGDTYLRVVLTSLLTMHSLHRTLLRRGFTAPPVRLSQAKVETNLRCYYYFTMRTPSSLRLKDVVKLCPPVPGHGRYWRRPHRAACQPLAENHATTSCACVCERPTPFAAFKPRRHRQSWLVAERQSTGQHKRQIGRHKKPDVPRQIKIRCKTSTSIVQINSIPLVPSATSSTRQYHGFHYNNPRCHRHCRHNHRNSHQGDQLRRPRLHRHFARPCRTQKVVRGVA